MWDTNDLNACCSLKRFMEYRALVENVGLLINIGLFSVKYSVLSIGIIKHDPRNSTLFFASRDSM